MINCVCPVPFHYVTLLMKTGWNLYPLKGKEVSCITKSSRFVVAVPVYFLPTLHQHHISSPHLPPQSSLYKCPSWLLALVGLIERRTKTKEGLAISYLPPPHLSSVSIVPVLLSDVQGLNQYCIWYHNTDNTIMCNVWHAGLLFTICGANGGGI